MAIAAAHGEPTRKQPVHVGMKDGSLFAMGGVAERWRSPDGETILDTCTIITTAANAKVQPVHDRMPLIVPREHYARWLDPALSAVPELLVPFPAEEMAWYPVSTRVNNVHHDSPALIECVEPMPPGEAYDGAPPPHPPEQESLF